MEEKEGEWRENNALAPFAFPLLTSPPRTEHSAAVIHKCKNKDFAWDRSTPSLPQANQTLIGGTGTSLPPPPVFIVENIESAEDRRDFWLPHNDRSKRSENQEHLGQFGAIITTSAQSCLILQMTLGSRRKGESEKRPLGHPDEPGLDSRPQGTFPSRRTFILENIESAEDRRQTEEAFGCPIVLAGSMECSKML